MRVFLVRGVIRMAGELLAHFRRDVGIGERAGERVAQTVKAEFGERAPLLALTFDLVLTDSRVAHDVGERQGKAGATANAAFLQFRAKRSAGIVACQLEQMVLEIRVKGCG